MSAQFEKNAAVGSLGIKTRRLSFDLSITGHATPGSKVFTSDLPGVCFLRAEGLTAIVDAIETETWTTAVDATNACFGIMLKGSELGTIKRVKKVEVSQVVATGSAIIARPPNSGTSFLTSEGNIVVEVLATGTDIGSGAEAPVVHFDIIYELSAI